MTEARMAATKVPTGDRDTILDWVDAGSRERAQQVLDAQAKLPPEERDVRLVVDLTAWLEGATVDDGSPSEAGTKLASTLAREEEMYLAELVEWERMNPGKSRAVPAGSVPDDPGEVA
jgi:hypothetical protein